MEQTGLHVEERNRFELTDELYLIDNSAISGKRRGAAAAAAIRNQAPGYLNFLSFEITKGKCRWPDLRDYLLRAVAIGDFRKQLESICAENGFLNKPLPWCEVAIALLFLEASPLDELLAAELLKTEAPRLSARLGSTKIYQSLNLQCAIKRNDLEFANDLLESLKKISDEERSFYKQAILPESERLVQFNKIFSGHGLSDFELDDRNGSFNLSSLSFPGTSPAQDETTASTHKATANLSVAAWVKEGQEASLRLALKSIAWQTLQPQEIVIACIGHSNVDFEDLGLDQDRVKLVTVAPETSEGGAMNVAANECKGKFIAFQSPYVISHPERLEKQLLALEQDKERVACFAGTVETSSEDLTPVLGAHPYGVAPETLVVEKKFFVDAGEFLATDCDFYGEFKNRLALADTVRYALLELPLAIQVNGSEFSRFSFIPGLVDSTNRLFESSYRKAHRDFAGSGEKLTHIKHKLDSVWTPEKRSQKNQPQNFDVILGGDWRKFGGPQKSMIEEIKALRKAGFKVGVLHMEAGRFMETTTAPLCDPIQAMINAGEVELCMYQHEAHTSLLILRYPPILQVTPRDRSAIEVDRMLVLANQAPSELDGQDIRYTVPEVTRGAVHCFGVHPTWAPQGPQVRKAISPYLASDELTPFNIPGIVDYEEWRGDYPRKEFSPVPVIGRHSRDNAMKWPEAAAVLKQIYPLDGSVRIRTMGGTNYVKSVLKLKELPEIWEDLPKDDLPVAEFLHSIEYFVFFQNSNAIEAFGRAILEAIAANLVVILPHQYQEVFGEAALYADPSEVSGLISHLHSNPSEYVSQQEKAMKKLNEDFTYEAYVDRVRSLIGDREFEAK